MMDTRKILSDNNVKWNKHTSKYECHKLNVVGRTVNGILAEIKRTELNIPNHTYFSNRYVLTKISLNTDVD